LREIQLPSRFGFVVTEIKTAQGFSTHNSVLAENKITVDYSGGKYVLDVSFTCDAVTDASVDVPVAFNGVFLEIVDGQVRSKTENIRYQFCEAVSDGPNAGVAPVRIPDAAILNPTFVGMDSGLPSKE